ncbi:endosialidase [Synechococcus phage S-B05]|nr:endosialidase [Synechococcus phage S-B05]
MGLSLRGQTSGAVDINAPAVAGDNTITLPNGNGSANQFYKNSTTAGIVTHSSMIELANGRVGVGTTNPSETLTLNHADGASIGLEYGGIENGTINVNSAAMYVRAGSNRQLIIGADGTEGARFNSNNGFGINATTIPAGVNVAVGGTIRVQDTANSAQYLTINHQGIDFQNTGAGSAGGVTAHTLDDYEEGEWTPTIATESGSNYTLDIARGHYVKVGKLVYVMFQCRFTAEGSGTITVISMPFARATNHHTILNGYVSDGNNRMSIQYTNYTSASVLPRLDSDTQINYWTSRASWAPTNTFVGTGCYETT